MRLISISEVSKHTTPTSCWVILYGQVYDVTDFLSQHPGGATAILSLAGKDATREFDAVHPPGTLEGEGGLGVAKLGWGVFDGEEKGVMKEKEKGKGEEKEDEGKEVEKEEEKEKDIDIKPLLSLDDIESAAAKTLSKRAWSYYYSASDSHLTKTHNRLIYRQILLRPRILRSVSTYSVSTTLLGHPVGLPIFISPVALPHLAHPSAETGIAHGLSPFSTIQIISSNASLSPEAIIANSPENQIFGWQIYIQTDRDKTTAMLARINALSHRFKFVVLTVDAPVPGKRELDLRQKGIGASLATSNATDLTWEDTLPWLRQHTPLPIIIKGIQTHNDAHLASLHPLVSAIILSNHGGRALDTSPPAIHTLLEIRKYCPQVLDRTEVWVDGGVSRGTDVVKAICLGAKGVGVGRGVLWGLVVGGGRGVGRVLEILRDEMITCMRLLGVQRVSQLGMEYVNTRAVERDIYDGDAGLEVKGLWVKSKM